MAFSMAMPWNAGEEKMHKLLRIPAQDNPTSTGLTPQAFFMFQRAPLLALGTLDAESRPWTTLWGGEPAFSEPLGEGFIGTRTFVDGKNDPVVRALVGDAEKEAILQSKEGLKLVAGLAIDLMTRKRVKIAGRMIAGTLRDMNVDAESRPGTKQEQIQLVTKITQSLGNCPKYLNQYEIQPAFIAAELASQSSWLSEKGQALIANSDMFFLVTSTEDDMDVNHRGGPPGFVRIISPTQIAYPEYSGNRLYQSLGNLQLNSKIGVTFPNYKTGDVLYTTGTAEILVGADAAALLPGSNLAVKITIDEARYVAHGLPFRGTRKQPSPYNPLVRRLTTEGNIKASLLSEQRRAAHLIQKTILESPSIARFTFSVPDGIAYKPGQWVALDFSHELDVGYEHMRDNDPSSLNDDFVRTFTITSVPKSCDGKDQKGEKVFDITIRRIGPVTNLLFRQDTEGGLEVPILGVGGDFNIRQGPNVTTFIAGGVGITPLLAQLHTLHRTPDRLSVLWSVRVADAGFVRDSFTRYPGLAGCTTVFFTGDTAPYNMTALWDLLPTEASMVERRMERSDVERMGQDVDRWYLCAGKALKGEVLAWLEGKEVLCEDFVY
ncbi:hypothetical protein BDW02DRAFT_191707 [Decorospora gaudefroyi]|uniref:FAD-binding FR-type domain-containing protein n=1 Tax=Decorospora gaudefroyi TaxID=184978 RepID=A0A6A5JZ82_9PLEO|nr:hypothetical protein BDW02DRAFT_191707 [Decorospora gaudefroyi]